MNNCDSCGWWNDNIPHKTKGQCEVTLLLTNADDGCDSYENLQEAHEDYARDLAEGGDDG